MEERGRMLMKGEPRGGRGGRKYSEVIAANVNE
jgi:hypothetical protein